MKGFGEALKRHLVGHQQKQREGGKKPSSSTSKHDGDVRKLLEHVVLEGGPIHTEMILAKYGEQILGGPEDRGRIALRWYRIRLISDSDVLWNEEIKHLNVGSRVKLKGLVKKTTLNGRIGTIADLDYRKTGNLAVRLDACSWDRSRLLQIRRVNILLASSEEEEEVEISFDANDDSSSNFGKIKETYELLDNVKGGFYQPSVDDVGTRICIRVQGLGENSSLTKIAATSVLCLDSEVKRVCEENMKELESKREIAFEVRKCTDVKSCTLVLCPDRIEFRDETTSILSSLRLRSNSRIKPSPCNAHHFTIEDLKLTAKTNIQRDVIIRCVRLVISRLAATVHLMTTDTESGSSKDKEMKNDEDNNDDDDVQSEENTSKINVENTTKKIESVSRYELEIRKLKDENESVRTELRAALKSSMNHIQSLQMKDSTITDLKSRLKAKDKIYNQLKSQIRQAVETRNSMESQEIRALEKMQSLETRIQMQEHRIREQDKERSAETASEFEDTKRLLEESSSQLRRYRSLLQDSEKRHDEQLDEQQLQIDALESELTEAEKRADEARANMVDLEWKYGESESSLSLHMSKAQETGITIEKYESEIMTMKKRRDAVKEKEEVEMSQRTDQEKEKKLCDWNESEERAALIAERNALRQKCKSLKGQLAKRVDTAIHIEMKDEDDESLLKRTSEQKYHKNIVHLENNFTRNSGTLDMARGRETMLRDRLNVMFPMKMSSGKVQPDWLGDTDKKQREEFVKKIRRIGATPPESEGDFHAARVYIDAKKISVYDCEQWLDYLRLKQAVTESNGDNIVVVPSSSKMMATSKGNNTTSWFSTFGASGQLMETNKQLRQVSAALSKKVSRLDGRIADLELELHVKNQKIKELSSDDGVTSDDIFGGMEIR